MALSPVALCSRALMKLGAPPIQSFHDDRVEAELAASLFTPTYEALLSSYPWRFALQHMALPKLSDAPLADFSAAFQLPPDCLRVLSVGNGGSGKGITFRIVGQKIHTDSDTALVTYIRRAEAATAPPYVDQALIARLAAEFCLPLTESASRAELLYRLADIEFEKAKRIDAQQDTPQALFDFSLINARES